ncbi:T9SS type A sorting domain-containing protein [Mangrovimonas sp. TPBH4]|uniref:T9SS type A sorting domain-containing protein n=1 Tax=Mangrovimonas sp. TPBH4 TaxID=1645914 RepID=UPI000A9832BE|nr:T9SS type A sorting domain-containing protein [Mangrovimonas sp. TPBH4]
MKKQLLKLVLIAIPIVGLMSFKSSPMFFDAGWVIYQADVLPDVFDPPFQESSAGTSFTNAIVVDPDDATNNLLEMECPGTSFYWRMNFANNDVTVDNLTVVMRVKGNPNYDVPMDIDMHYNDVRTRISFDKDYNELSNVARVRNGEGETTELGVDLDEWHIYRFTMTAEQAMLYIDESDTPVMTVIPQSSESGNSHFRFGDGSSTENEFGASVDWVVWDSSGAYSPSELALPEAVLSVDSFTANSAWVGPVPTKDMLYVNHPNASGDSQIKVFNLSGKLVKSIETQGNLERTEIDMSQLAAGLYIVNYKNGNQEQQFKVLKE